MAENIFYANCPVDCDDVLLLPAITVEQDCTSYEQTLSQVSDLFLQPEGAPDIFTTFNTSPVYVAASVDNTVSDNSKSKWLVGIGSIAVPDKETKQYPKGKLKTVNRDYPLVFTVYNMTAAQYAFLVALQCGSTAMTVYYGDRADLIYGKQGGIVPKSIDVDFPKGGGETDVNQAIITIRWNAKGDPFRGVNPFAV